MIAHVVPMIASLVSRLPPLPWHSHYVRAVVMESVSLSRSVARQGHRPPS